MLKSFEMSRGEKSNLGIFYFVAVSMRGSFAIID